MFYQNFSGFYGSSSSPPLVDKKISLLCFLDETDRWYVLSVSRLSGNCCTDALFLISFRLASEKRVTRCFSQNRSNYAVNRLSVKLHVFIIFHTTEEKHTEALEPHF